MEGPLIHGTVIITTGMKVVLVQKISLLACCTLKTQTKITVLYVSYRGATNGFRTFQRINTGNADIAPGVHDPNIKDRRANDVDYFRYVWS